MLGPKCRKRGLATLRVPYRLVLRLRVALIYQGLLLEVVRELELARHRVNPLCSRAPLDTALVLALGAGPGVAYDDARRRHRVGCCGCGIWHPGQERACLSPYLLWRSPGSYWHVWSLQGLCRSFGGDRILYFCVVHDSHQPCSVAFEDLVLLFSEVLQLERYSPLRLGELPRLVSKSLTFHLLFIPSTVEQVAPSHSVFDYSCHLLELCLSGESACPLLTDHRLFW